MTKKKLVILAKSLNILILKKDTKNILIIKILQQ